MRHQSASAAVVARRRLLTLLALAVVAVAAVLLVGALSGGSPDLAGLARESGTKISEVTIHSRDVGQTLETSVVVPGGAPPTRRRPLLVFLHGRGADDRSFLNAAMLSALKAQGARAPVVAFPDGKESYWHDRRGQSWGAYVTDEVIPKVAKRFHTDPRRVAIGGISMGGFGALDLTRLHPGRFCAVGAHSPAIWQTGGETAAGAFDDGDDFSRHDVVSAARSDPAAFAKQPLWIDAGTEDPFAPGDTALTDALRAGGVAFTEHHWPGAHENGYWDAHWKDYFRFYGRALSRCR